VRSVAISQPRNSRDLGANTSVATQKTLPFFPNSPPSSGATTPALTRSISLRFRSGKIGTGPTHPNVKLSKTNEGTLYTKISSVLSGLALLAIFVYQIMLNYVLVHGGTYPSAGIVIVSMIMLTFSGVFGFYGARLLHSRAGLAVPIVSTCTLFAFFIQWEWCLRYCVRP
jgi:hypothetical protein